MRWKDLFWDKARLWGTDPRMLYFGFVAALLLPNVALCFTEHQWSVWARVCNFLMPLAAYAALSASSRQLGRTVWLLFPLVFLAAFQLVLIYLFGGSIIAVDMFLNLVTTNPGEALELLDNLMPAVLGVFIVYVPILVWAGWIWARKQMLDVAFLHCQRKRALVGLWIGGLCTAGGICWDEDYELKSELYPLNVCYNLYLAVERAGQSAAYPETSKDFTFQAKSTHDATLPEVYVLVIGETARASNFGLYGYERETTPLLEKTDGLLAFPDVLTQSNTTHKSVPMLLSAVTADHYDHICRQKGILTAFKEAGFHTAFFSNQLPNHSFIDYFGEEADDWMFIKQTAAEGENLSDDRLLALVESKLEERHRKLFIVLHMYGSHFNYRERYSTGQSFFKPDSLTDAHVENRPYLVNAYDNTIRHTDYFLATLVQYLQQSESVSALLYTSDHGEDLYDDTRQRFLHASPIPTYYQLHVPFLVWASPAYRMAYPKEIAALQMNLTRPVSSNATVFPTMLQLAGIVSPYREDSLSVASMNYRVGRRHYLNDHNEPRPLDKIGLHALDVQQLKQRGLAYP